MENAKILAMNVVPLQMDITPANRDLNRVSENTRIP